MTRVSKPRIGRPPLFDKPMEKILWLVVPDALMLAIDQRVKRERTARPGLKISRADVTRELLMLGLKKSAPARRKKKAA